MKTLSSLQFALVILVTIAVVAVIGTVIPQRQSPDFYREHYGTVMYTLISIFRFDRTYSSPLFMGLFLLFGCCIVLCSLIKFPRLLVSTFKPDLTPDSAKLRSMPVFITLNDRSLDGIRNAFSQSGFTLRQVGENRLFGEKGRIGYLGASTVHISLLVLLVGGLISLVTGVRGNIILENGESASSVVVQDGHEVPLGFSITLDRFEVSFYKTHPGRPKSYTSSVTVTGEDGTAFKRDIRVNHPLMYNGFTVYQASYGITEHESPVTASDDTARVSISLKGAPDTMPPIAIFDMVVGAVYIVPGFGDSIRVRLAGLYRDYGRGGSSIGAENPAVKIDVLVHNKTRWSVFAFKNFPGLNMPMNQELDFTFTMQDLLLSGDNSGDRRESEYYTVLGVVKDDGIPVMWFGAMLMMTGMFLSFYLQPRRIWVRAENGEIQIGARAKGDSAPLREFIMKTARKPEKA